MHIGIIKVMKDSTNKKNSFVNYELLGLFDEQFNIDSFKDSINNELQKSYEIVDAIVKTTKNDNKQNDVKLVVNMSDDLKTAYKNGDIVLDTGKNGEMYAQVRKNGKYGKKLSISEEIENNEISSNDIAFAVELNSIKEQLNNIVDALQALETYVVDIVEGLHNDRVGLFYSGLSSYMEASQISNSSLKELMISQSIKSINDSQAQMIQEFKNDVKYLINHEYDNDKNQKRQIIIKDKMNNIHICFELIYRSTMLKTMIYFDIKQLSAMFMVLEEYGRFIEKIVKPNASKLVEFDPMEDKLINTIWGSRANSFRECEDIKEKLLSNKRYYITTEA